MSLGGWTAPGDGANGDAAASRGWRRGRSRRFAAEWEGLGLRRAKRAGMRCVCKVQWRSRIGSFASLLLCLFYKFFWTNFLRWHAPRLFVALAPSLIFGGG